MELVAISTEINKLKTAKMIMVDSYVPNILLSAFGFWSETGESWRVGFEGETSGLSSCNSGGMGVQIFYFSSSK
jgi:hypothetical protein